MVEITLQKYLSRQEGLLKQGRYDEAIAHCRHILTHYPRSAATHYRLAQALVGAGQLDEARKSFERVLAVYPDDANAYAGLARIALQERRYDDALALFSRAYDLDPANGAIIKDLRDLYAQRRNEPNARLPQGIYTTAKQQMNAELYHRAIETLEHAVEKQNTRYDLRVLLIESLYASGDALGAGKAALELLKILPNCAVANRIMAQIWLAQKRPSDAQRYVSALEMVDPYAAFELVQGGAVPEKAFLVEELDYEREVKRELVNLEPDWLDSLNDRAEDAFGLEDMPSFNDEPSPTEDNLDWMNEISEVQPSTQSPTRAVKLPSDMDVDSLASVLDELPDKPMFEDNPPPIPTRSGTGLTGLLSVLEDDAAPLDDAHLDDLLADATPLPSSGTGLTGLLSGLNEEANQDTDLTNPVPEDVFADMPSDFADEDSLDPMAWLHDEGIELLDTDAQQAEIDNDPFGSLGEQESIVDPHADDPLAWLKDEGIDLLDTNAQQAEIDNDPFGALGFQEPITDPHADDPLAWLKDQDIDFEESEPIDPTPMAEVPMFGAASLPRDYKPESLDDDDDDLDLFGALEDDDAAEHTEDTADPLAWMRDHNIELIDDDEDLEDSLDWMKDPEDFSAVNTAASASENVGNALDLFADFEPSEDDGEDIMASDFDWSNLQDDDSQDDGLEWLAADDSALDAIGNTGANEPLFDEAPAQLETANAMDSALNWLEDSDDDLLSDEDDFALDSEPFEADMPDWLSSMRVDDGSAEDEEAPMFSAEDDTEIAPESAALPSWFNLDSDDEEPIEFTDETLADEQILPYAANTNAEEAAMPDWLSAVGTGAQESFSLMDDAQDDEDDTFSLFDAQDEQEEDDELLIDSEPIEEAAMPDWLSAVGTGAQESFSLMDDAQDDEDDTFSLFDVEEDQEEEELLIDSEPIEEAAMPDWLSAVGTGTQESFSLMDDAQDDEDDAFSLFDAQDEQEEDDELLIDSEPIEEASMPDWLSAMQATDEEEEEALEEEEAQSYAYFENDAQPADDTAIPDWLSTAENAAVDMSEVADEEQPDWLGSIGTSNIAEEEYEVDDAQPDWMAEALIEPNNAIANSALDNDAYEQDIEEEAPSWLGASAQIDETLFNQFEEDADLLDTDIFEITEEIAITPADNAPDFLNAMVPGLDVDITDQDADEPLETEYLEDAEDVKQQTDYAWVAAIVDEELRPPSTLPSATSEVPAVSVPRRRFEFSAPPAWLRKLRAQKATPDQSEETLPDWLDFDDDTN